MFNNHYINIVQKTSDIAPESLRDSSLPENDEETVNKILKHYENHPSVLKNKYNQNETLNIYFPAAKVEDITKMIKSLNPKLCANCAFPQNFHTRKLDEITLIQRY